MKFNISRADLLEALNIVLKGMSSRSTLPILSGILIDAQDGGTLIFQTTDLEISIKHSVQADVIERGKTVVPGKLFSDIAKNLPDAAVTVSTDRDQVVISCMDSNFTLSALDAADFPYFPEVIAEKTVKLPTADMADAVKKVAKAVSRDESRMILTGILFSVENEKVRLASTDSYRLAVADMTVDVSGVDDFQAIVPGKIFDDVSKISGSADTIDIGFSDNQIMFGFGSTIFVSRKIEGTYPNYKQLIPADHAVSITVSTSALVTAIKRVALLAQSHTPIHFSFDSSRQQVEVSAKTQDVGGATETLPIEMEGESVEIAFNHQYILDGLSTIKGDTVVELQTSLKPGILKGTEDEGFLYLAMPVRLS